MDLENDLGNATLEISEHLFDILSIQAREKDLSLENFLWVLVNHFNHVPGRISPDFKTLLATSIANNRPLLNELVEIN